MIPCWCWPVCGRVRVGVELGELNPLLNFQPPCVLHLQPPGGRLNHLRSGFLATSIVFAIKIHKTLHFLLENSISSVEGTLLTTPFPSGSPPTRPHLTPCTPLVLFGQLQSGTGVFKCKLKSYLCFVRLSFSNFYPFLLWLVVTIVLRCCTPFYIATLI